jgi:hypothetical protein
MTQMKVSFKPIAGLLLGSLVTLSAGVAPAAAQGMGVIAPTSSTWAKWFGLETSRECVLGHGRTQIQIGDVQQPRRMRVCVTDNVGARVIADGRQTVVSVAHCRAIVGFRSPWSRLTPWAGIGASRPSTPSSADGRTAHSTSTPWAPSPPGWPLAGITGNRDRPRAQPQQERRRQ